MKRIILFSFILFAALTIRAQKEGINPGDPSFNKKYENFDFKGQFAVLVYKTGDYNYLLLDFSKFSTRFERIYFMNLSFTSDKLINIDSDIAKNEVWFKSDKMYDGPEIIKVFDEMKKKTFTAATSWTEEEKSRWLKENDKYK